MKPKFIIKSTEKGFQVFYIERYRFLTGFPVLKPYITYAGLDKVYTFKDIDTAIKELELEVIKNTKRI
jgi:hypothetical protein